MFVFHVFGIHISDYFIIFYLCGCIECETNSLSSNDRGVFGESTGKDGDYRKTRDFYWW